MGERGGVHKHWVYRMMSVIYLCQHRMQHSKANAACGRLWAEGREKKEGKWIRVLGET